MQIYIYFDGIWGVIGICIGAIGVFVILKPRIVRAESDAASERAKSEVIDKNRQQLEVELAGVRVVASRTKEVMNLLSERDAIISDLEKSAAALAL